jgi:hypothetical protein
MSLPMTCVGCGFEMLADFASARAAAVDSRSPASCGFVCEPDFRLLSALRIVARAGRSGRAQERSVARGARRARMLVVVVDKQAAMTTKSGLENIPGSESCVRQFECLRGLYLEASA